MLSLKIKSQRDEPLATIRVDHGGLVKFIGEYDKDFANLIEHGITQRQELYDQTTQSFAMIELPIKKNDVNFPLAFKEWLGRQGYKVIELHPEIGEEIKKILRNFPDDNEDKIDILKRLPEMSYLEMSSILEGLKRSL